MPWPKNRKESHNILRKEQLAKEETAAFGDGHNDLPMLEMVGYPIVMDNASMTSKRSPIK